MLKASWAPAWKRLLCWLFGCRPETDLNRGFSYRMQICTRCGRLPH